MRLADLGRANEILRVFARHGFGELLSKIPLGRIPGLKLISGRTHEGSPLTAAERLNQALSELGPTFVKLGQLLSTRPDLLPPHYITALINLREHVPPMKLEVVREILEEEWGGTPEELLAHFDPEPVASASIAQVHKAALPNGDVLAIKIRRRGIEQSIRSDMNILHALAVLAQESSAFPGASNLPALVQEFEHSLTQELDFINEADNARRFAREFAGDATVETVRVRGDLSRRRVLTMDWIDSLPLDQCAKLGLDPHAILDRLVAATFSQIVDHGFFHADPHPGNLRVTEDGRIVYLDLGQVGHLGDRARADLEDLFMAVALEDPQEVAHVLVRAGATPTVNRHQFARDVEALMQRYNSLALGDIPLAQLTADLLAMAWSHNLHLPKEFAVLAKAGSTLNGIATEMCPDWQAQEAMRPLVARLLKRRADPEALQMELLRLLARSSSSLKGLPLRLDQMLMDLERGQVSIRVENANATVLATKIDRAADLMVLAIVGVGCFVSAAVLLSSVRFDFGGGEVPSFLAIAGLLTTLGAGSAVTTLLVLKWLAPIARAPLNLARRLLRRN